MSERGSYRAITAALFDGKDFQTLTPTARLVFLALKVGFGPAGIEVHYPESLLWQLSHQTGFTPDECAEALVELETAESQWIRREANVVWIVGQLTYEPSLVRANPKHRKAISQHVKGLPRIALVRAFVTHYAVWFDDPDTLSKGYPEGTELPRHYTTLPKTEVVADATRRSARAVRPARPSSPAALPSPPAPPRDNWVGRLVDLWQGEVGRIAPGRLGEQLKASVTTHGVATIDRAMRSFIHAQKSAGKSCSFAFFVAEVEVWVERASTPLEVIGGEMNAALELATRPGRLG
jgi:hypothetical protein